MYDDAALDMGETHYGWLTTEHPSATPDRPVLVRDSDGAVLMPADLPAGHALNPWGEGTRGQWIGADEHGYGTPNGLKAKAEAAGYHVHWGP